MTTATVPRRIVVNMVAHNGEAHIEEALASIVRQTMPVDAVVVYDDASTDRTMEIVEAFTDRLPIEVRTLPDCGYDEFDAVYTRVGQQVSMGLRDLSDNDIILMTDLDDVWEDTRVEHQVGVFDAEPEVLVIAGSGPCIDASGTHLDRALTLDLGHADSSTMLGKREFTTWQGRTTRTSSVGGRWSCMSRRRARRSRASPSISGSPAVR